MNFKNLPKITLDIIRYLYRLLTGFVGISNLVFYALWGKGNTDGTLLGIGVFS